VLVGAERGWAASAPAGQTNRAPARSSPAPASRLSGQRLNSEDLMASPGFKLTRPRRSHLHTTHQSAFSFQFLYSCCVCQYLLPMSPNSPIPLPPFTNCTCAAHTVHYNLENWCFYPKLSPLQNFSMRSTDIFHQQFISPCMYVGQHREIRNKQLHNRKTVHSYTSLQIKELTVMPNETT